MTQVAYQVLARKWRPRSFGELAGQSHVLRTLVNALDNDRLHHAYLFTGTRGVGKTTIARILAKCLNCEQGVSSTPCGECSACREIDQGRFIDLIEVDAASRTKVEDTRELLDNVQYAPSLGRFKVYLIDEVHMLSGHSFNALLKTLEEPPPHVKFLLATTDPQKLPVTVLSRCLQFNLKNLSPEQIVRHLSHILEQENIPFEEAALWLLARAARGSVRDGLTLMDQAISYCDGHLQEAAVSDLLGTIDQRMIQRMVDTLNAGDAGQLLELTEQAAGHAVDFSSVLEELLTYLHRVAVAQAVPDAIDNSQGDRDSVQAHARSMTAGNLQLYYQIALKGREELPLSVSPRAGFEMTLLRMLAFVPTDLLPVEAQLEEAPAPQKKKPPLSPPEPACQNDGSSDHFALLPNQVVDPVDQVSGDAYPADIPPYWATEDSSNDNVLSAPAEPLLEGADDAQALRDKAAAPVNQPDSSPVPVRTPLETLKPDDWVDIFPALNVNGITRNIASHSVLTAVEGAQLTLLLHDAQASVFNEPHRKRIETALGDYFGQAVRLNMTLGEIDERHGETPAAWRRRREAERRQLALEDFQADENVREIVRLFSGRILTDTIERVDDK